MLDDITNTYVADETDQSLEPASLAMLSGWTNAETAAFQKAVSYTHLTLPTTPYV